jgi:hypothetical protein
MSAAFQEDQKRRRSTQKILSDGVNLGRECWRLKTANC